MQKINFRVVLGEWLAYAVIGSAGYLSFFGETESNILKNYGAGAAVSACRALLSLSLIVAIPTNANPTVRAFQGLVDACLPALPASPEMPPGKEPLLDCEAGKEQAENSGSS